MANTAPKPIGSSNNGSKPLRMARNSSVQPTKIMMICPSSKLAIPVSCHRVINPSMIFPYAKLSSEAPTRTLSPSLTCSS
ncbi:Uncharacterised protein [Vibrio cholerae]|nr:Uncharacterised protein [Vibrio cholerae]CSD19639.1 Uncharacterised protein [Vibrio cholerae]CSI53707.1 Uncharacterised protein [Vibrio cholerae]